MKKILLLFLFLIPMMFQAQTPEIYTGKEKCGIKDVVFMDDGKFVQSDDNNVSPILEKRGAGTVYKRNMSSSGNAYTLLIEESSCLYANQELNTVMFTHRANPSKFGNATGDIYTSYSQDNGKTWIRRLLIPEDGTNKHRYPSGVIMNPVGNKDVKKAYNVFAGPTVSSSWSNTFLGSASLDTSKASKYGHFPFTTSGSNMEVVFFRNNMISFGENVYVLGRYTDFIDNSGMDSFHVIKLLFKKGTFDKSGDSMKWEKDIVFDLNTILKEDTISPNQTRLNHSAGDMVWNVDGTIGYIYVLGADTTKGAKRHSQLISFKTTDSGVNWSRQPNLVLGDVPNLKDSMLAEMKLMVKDFKYTLSEPVWKYYYTTPGGTKYYGNENSAVVDANGHLHIISTIESFVGNHPDTMYYFSNTSANTYPIKLYDIHQTSSGWGFKKVGNIYSQSSNDIFSDIHVNHRLQTSRTTDGKHIFAVWTDTDFSFDPTNAAPNLFGWGYDIVNDKEHPVTQFTGPKLNSILDGRCFFHYISDITLVKNDTTFTIPVSISEIVGSNDPGFPTNHYYLDGIGYGQGTGVTSVKDLTSTNMISDIYPNPFEQTAFVNIKLDKTQIVNTQIFDLMGKTIVSESHNLQAGNNKIAITNDNLKSGIYLLKISVENNSKTQRFIVK